MKETSQYFQYNIFNNNANNRDEFISIMMSKTLIYKQ